MLKVIIALLKKYWKWAAIGGVAGYLLFQAYDCSRLLIQQAAWNAADAKYAAKIKAQDDLVATKEKKIREISEQAGKDREALRLKAEAEVIRANNVLIAFKSETARELKARQATIKEVLAEKEKDEIVITELKETIKSLADFGFLALFMWRLSEEKMLFEHKVIIYALNEKYTACETWRAKLEKKNKPSTFKSIVKFGKAALLIAGGYAAGKAL